jgi:hypothetical protein
MRWVQTGDKEFKYSQKTTGIKKRFDWLADKMHTGDTEFKYSQKTTAIKKRFN